MQLQGSNFNGAAFQLTGLNLRSLWGREKLGYKPETMGFREMSILRAVTVPEVKYMFGKRPRL